MARLVWQSGRDPAVPDQVRRVPHVRSSAGSSAARGRSPSTAGRTDASKSLHDAVVADRAGRGGSDLSRRHDHPGSRASGRWRAGPASPGSSCNAPDTPVVPVGQWGAQHRTALPWWRKARPPPCRCIGRQPLDLSKYRDREPTAETLREITDVIMDAVRAQVAEVAGRACARCVLQADGQAGRQEAPPLSPQKRTRNAPAHPTLAFHVTFTRLTVSWHTGWNGQVRPLCRSAGAALTSVGRNNLRIPEIREVSDPRP